MNELTLVKEHLDLKHHFQNLNRITSKWVEPSYYPVLELRIEHNERWNLNKFTEFKDEEMMYYYLHQRKHIRSSRERKANTKTEYLRNLFQFYKHAVESEHFLKHDVEDYQEGSILKNLRTRHIKRYQEYISTALLGKGNKPYSPATIDVKVTILKGFFKWLYEVEYIIYPLHRDFLSTTLAEEDIPNRDLYYHEVKQLLEFYKDHPINHALLTMLAMTGLRIQEIAAARWCDLYFDVLSGHYRLRGVGKRDKPFDRLIHQVLYDRILIFRRRRKVSTQIDIADKSPLFPTKDGNHYTFKNLSNYIIRMIEKTGLPFVKQRETKITPHSFRHFYAIYSRQQGADIFLIQKELGHSDRKTTERYLEKVLQREQEVGLLWNQEHF